MVTKPTQAQIEAAAKSFYERGGDKNFPWETEKETIKVIYRKYAKAALAAAAEVKESKRLPWQEYPKDDPPVTEYQLMLVLHDKCPRCRGELDTGWECNRCDYDAGWLAAILYPEALPTALKDKP